MIDKMRCAGRLIRVASLESDGFNCPSNPTCIISAARGAAKSVDIVTFVQTLPRRERMFDYYMEYDNFAVLPVTTFEHWWTKQIDFKVRNKARKGEKNGLLVREIEFDDEVVRGISEIYNETPVRQGKKFWHYQKSLEIVRRENATFLDQSILVGAFLGEQLVGFMKLVVDAAGGQAAVMQILSMIKHRDKAPTNALIAQGVRSCADRQIANFVYAHFSYGQKHEDSLATFKRANGFVKVDVPRYFVPLTLRGRLGLRLGLHHRLSERLPDIYMSRLRKMRSTWYARRFGGATAG